MNNNLDKPNNCSVNVHEYLAKNSINMNNNMHELQVNDLSVGVNHNASVNVNSSGNSCSNGNIGGNCGEFEGEKVHVSK
jgi:hypothetical protein